MYPLHEKKSSYQERMGRTSGVPPIVSRGGGGGTTIVRMQPDGSFFSTTISRTGSSVPPEVDAVRSFMESLGQQDNVNLDVGPAIEEQPATLPGVVRVGGTDGDDGAFPSFREDRKNFTYTAVVAAHLASENEKTMIDAPVMTTLKEVEEVTRRSYGKRKVVGTMFLALTLILVCTLLGRNRRPETEDIASTMAPSYGPLHPLLIELQDTIAPTDADLLLFRDPTSPQAQAMEWLQDDPITLMPGQSTRTILERYALAVLYFSTSGLTWRVKYWTLSDTSVCGWNSEWVLDVMVEVSGVICNKPNGTVTSIVLDGNNLHGTIPWELILLWNLSYLDLQANSLEGGIPSRINELTQLEILDLTHNQLMGPLPEALPPNLLILDLDSNLFSGSIPAEWGTTRSRLESLDLSTNALTGPLPTTFGQLQKLFDNSLTGEIPSELVGINSLSTLWFGSTTMTGSVSKRFCGRPNVLDLQGDCDEVECPCCIRCCSDSQDDECGWY